MKSSRQLSTLLVSVLGLIALMVFLSNVLPKNQNRHLAGAEFLVS